MSNSRMEGRRAIVTGAGAGIGAATAMAFSKEGAAVLLVDRDEVALNRTLARIKGNVTQARVAVLSVDVTDESAASLAVELCNKAWGGVDTLVNNAAMRNYSAASAATPKEWQAIVSVNLIGMSNFCSAALPELRASGRGSIVNVSSCYAVTGRKGMALYDSTKAGQLAYTRSLAFEESPHGVRVNAVCPGSTLTDFHVSRAEKGGKSLEQLQSERQDTSLIGRWASPDEIAMPILWLASSEASFITGTTLMVDGGLHIM